MRKKETRDISDIIEHRMKVLNITGTRKLRRIQSEGGGGAILWSHCPG